MSNIHGVGGNSQINKVVSNPIYKQTPPPATSAPGRGGDKVELSGMQQMLQSLKAGGDVRAEKVAEVKAAIEAGTYENDQKLDAAIDRMLDDLI